MSKKHTVTLHHVFTLYNVMFDYMDGVMKVLAKMKSQCEEELYLAVKLARQTLSTFNPDVTPTTGALLTSAHLLDPFQTLQSVRKWDKGMDINPDDNTSYITQYQKAFPN